MHTLKRGADGWRGIITEQFSPLSANHLSLGIAHFLREKKGNFPFLITHDGRLLSQEVAAGIAETLADSGFDAVLGGMQSTPATSSFLTQGQFAGAIIVTASHNPFYWNGIKVKVSPSCPLSRDDESSIETMLETFSPKPQAKKGRISSLDRETIFSSYARCSMSVLTQKEVDEIRKRKFKIIVDALHGMSADAYRVMFEDLGCECTILGEKPHPLFHGILPDPMNPLSRRRIVEQMKREHYDLGFISDGDGDRLGVLNEKGIFVWPHDVLGLLAESLFQENPSNAGIAVSGPTGTIIDRICQKFKRECWVTPVGFKYASAYLQNQKALLIGGAVGEIGFAGANMDRDPLKSIALLLRCCLKGQKPFSERIQDLHDRYGSGVYKQWTLSNISKTIDIKTLGLELIASLGFSVQEITIPDGYKFKIDPAAWILIREATTEKGLRVYAELHSEEELARCFELLREKTGVTPQEKA